jgi:UDP-galactopyranose mutase
VGRLATYKYYNTDQVTAQALSLFKKLKAEEKKEPATKRALLQAAVGHSSLTSIVEVAKAVQPEDSGDFQADAEVTT